MMGVFIEGMEMPKQCGGCPFMFSSWGIEYYCSVTKSSISAKYVGREKMTNCPLIDIPTPHGRLGDLDALQEQIKLSVQDAHMSVLWKQGMAYAHGLIEASKAVIKSEGETE